MQTDYSSLFTAGLFQLCPHDQSEQPQQQRRASSNDSSVLASPTSSARPSRRPTISEQYRSFLSFDVAESLRSLTLSRNDSWSFKSWTSSRSPSQPRVLTSEPALLHPQPKRSLETLRKSSGSPDSARSRRSLPSPKPAPSSPLPAAPSFPLTPSTASSPILPSQRLPTPPPPPSPSKFTPKAAPAYTPTLARSRSQRSREAGITHSAPAPSSSEIDSLRTVSTNYKRTKRSDALAKLEGRHHVRRESGGVPALPPLPSLGELDLGINIPILATEASSPPRPKKRVSKLGVDNSKSRNRRITMMGSSTTPSSFIPFIDMDVDADMEVESAEIDAESNLHPDADTCGRTELIEESFNLSLPHAHIHPHSHSHSHSHHRAHSQSEADEEEEVEVEMEMEGGEDIDPLAYAMSLSSLSPPPSTTLSMLLGCNDSSSPTYSTFSSAFSMSGASGVSRGRGRSTKARNGKRRSSSERFPRNFMDMGDADSIWSPSSHSSHSASLSLGSIPIFV